MKGRPRKHLSSRPCWRFQTATSHVHRCEAEKPSTPVCVGESTPLPVLSFARCLCLSSARALGNSVIMYCFRTYQPPPKFWMFALLKVPQARDLLWKLAEHTSTRYATIRVIVSQIFDHETAHFEKHLGSARHELRARKGSTACHDLSSAWQ